MRTYENKIRFLETTDVIYTPVIYFNLPRSVYFMRNYNHSIAKGIFDGKL